MRSLLSIILGALCLGLANVASAASTAGCGKATTITSGTKSMTVNGKTRQYIVSMPGNYNPNNPYRLIFGMHWLNGNMNAVSNDGFYNLLPRAGNSTIFVAPNGINAGWGNSGGEDVTFVDQIISTISAGACVDTSLIFSAGWSYGGSMSYALACARGSVFRAVAVYSGANLSGCAGGTTPVAYLGVHGIHDSVLNISQGRSIRDTFVRADGCQSQSPPEPAQGSNKHIKTQYSGCSSGHPVTWIAFDGDHTWTPQDGGGGGVTNTYVSPETWSFFSQFTGSGTTTTTTTTTTGTTTTTTTTTTSSPTSCTVPKWGQCGGSGYTGCKTCASGSTCTYSNEWYSQCL